MTSRNDLATAHARIESLERAKRALAEQNALLNAHLEAPLPKAAEPAPPTRVESSPPLTADTEPNDEIATWPVTVFVTVLSLAIAAIIMAPGST
jgi:hypothetical protein